MTVKTETPSNVPPVGDDMYDDAPDAVERLFLYKTMEK